MMAGEITIRREHVGKSIVATMTHVQDKVTGFWKKITDEVYHPNRKHLIPAGRHKQLQRKIIRKLPPKVWMRRIKITQVATVKGSRSINSYQLDVYIEDIDKTCTVKAEGNTCPIPTLITKIQLLAL